MLLGHALGHELERRERVEGGERRLDREQHERERAHGGQLQHQPHLFVRGEQLRARAALLRAVLVLLDEQHADRRAHEDPAPEEEEAAQRRQAERVEPEEAHVREEVPAQAAATWGWRTLALAALARPGPPYEAAAYSGSPRLPAHGGGGRGAGAHPKVWPMALQVAPYSRLRSERMVSARPSTAMSCVAQRK